MSRTPYPRYFNSVDPGVEAPTPPSQPPIPPPTGPKPMDKTLKWLLIGCGGIIILLILAVLLSVFLCKRVAQETMSKMTGIENFKVNSKDGGVTISGKDAQGNEASFKAGEKVVLPDDVPTYPGAEQKGGFSASGKGKAAIVATLESSDDAEKVATWYKDQLKSNGWGDLQESNINTGDGGVHSLVVKKVKRTCSINVTKSKGDAKTTVLLTVGED